MFSGAHYLPLSCAYLTLPTYLFYCPFLLIFPSIIAFRQIGPVSASGKGFWRIILNQRSRSFSAVLKHVSLLGEHYLPVVIIFLSGNELQPVLLRE